MSPADWEHVKHRHDKKFEKKQRTVAALQRKFTTLHRTKEPTGDPNLPSPVRIAKQIRNMIDEKTDGTRGSADSSALNELGAFDEEDDEDLFNGPPAMGNDVAITPLTPNAVHELARLGGHAEKPFFEPIVQVVHLHKKPESDYYDVQLSDGINSISGKCSQPVSALADEEYFTLYSFIKVQEFSTATLADGAKFCELLRVENTMVPNPGEKIGNPVNIS